MGKREAGCGKRALSFGFRFTYSRGNKQCDAPVCKKVRCTLCGRTATSRLLTQVPTRNGSVNI